MKKVLSLILAIVLVAGLLVPAYAAEVTTVTLTPKKEGTEVTELAVGDQFTVDATLSGNTGFAAMTIGLVWNAAVVTFKGFSTNFNEDDEVEELAGTILSQSVIINQSKGIVTNARTNNSTKNGLIFTANFEVIGSGTTGIGLIEDKENISCFQMKTATGVELETQIIDEPVNLTIPGQETKYVIKFGEIVNGTVAAKVGETEVTEAAVGEKVTLIPTPADGYKLSNLTVMNGEIPVEVTNNTFEMPAAAVTVSATFEAIPAGYSVSASENVEITAGENAVVQIQVANSNADVTAYNAYDLIVTYPEGLTYVSAVGSSVENDTAEVKHDETARTVHIIGYGADKAVTMPAATLTFTSSIVGEYEVTITSAKVDAAGQATVQNAPDANILDATTKITVTGYAVTLGEGLEAESLVANPGEDYTFEATDSDNYNYTVTATIGGEKIEVTDNSDGTYTIPGENVTGNISITAVKVEKTYDVTIDGTKTEDAATYNDDYTFTPAKDGYTVKSVSVTIGGEMYTIGNADENGTYTIPGTAITGDIEITIEWDPVTSDNVAVKKSDGISGDNTVAKGNEYKFSFADTDKYDYDKDSLKVEIGEGEFKTDITEQVTYDEETGEYTIPAGLITGPVTITVSRTEKNSLTVDVVQYLKLNDFAMYLVTVSGVPEGNVAKYDGQSMYWSAQTLTTTDEGTEDVTGYGAYAWLVISELDRDTVKADAVTKISVAEGNAAGNVDYSGDVNRTTRVDVNDAQLAFNMYNAWHSSFDETNGGVSMLKFLNADVNSDKTVNSQDAQAIVSTIVGN